MNESRVSRRTALKTIAAAPLLPAVLAAAPTAAALGRAAPAADVIMIIRHGEKPKDGTPPYGVTVDGQESKHALTPFGWARAGALVNLFAPATGAPRSGLARPTAVYAASVATGTGHSMREQETVGLVAAQLGVKVQTQYGVGQEKALATHLMATGGALLVGWEHKHIPTIAHFLTGVAPTPPTHWPGHRFDVVWVFTKTTSGGYAFSQVPQLLLPGDEKSVIG